MVLYGGGSTAAGIVSSSGVNGAPLGRDGFETFLCVWRLITQIVKKISKSHEIFYNHENYPEESQQSTSISAIK